MIMRSRPTPIMLVGFACIVAASLTACANRTAPPLAPTDTPIAEEPTSDPTEAAVPPSSTRIIGYFTSWGIYDRNFQVTDVDGSRLTHLNYAFANVDYETFTCKIGDEWADLDKPYPGDVEG